MSGHRRRVGILGGTFDPPHIGHVAVASSVRSALRLDEVLFVVANDPWQKSPTMRLCSPADRLAMVEAAVADIPGLRASAIEIDRGGPSYMVDTLREIAAQQPDTELFLIVGADAAAGIGTWERHGELPALATLVIVDRPGAGTELSSPLGQWNLVHVEGPGLEVSSTRLRSQLEQGITSSDLLPPAVVEYIDVHGLYEVNHV